MRRRGFSTAHSLKHSSVKRPWLIGEGRAVSIGGHVGITVGGGRPGDNTFEVTDGGIESHTRLRIIGGGAHPAGTKIAVEHLVVELVVIAIRLVGRVISESDPGDSARGRHG